MTSLHSLVVTWLLRIAVASVWLYHGLWNKLLSPAGRHAHIVESVRSLFGIPSGTLLLIVGTVEVALAVWVLLGVVPRAAAIVQSVLLVAMNLGGLLWANDAIADPGGMIVQNAAFLALVWVVACRDAAQRERNG